MIVIKESDKRFVQRLVDAGRFIPKDVAADVLVYTPQEFQAMVEGGNPFIEQALSEGTIVYDTGQGQIPRKAASLLTRPPAQGGAFMKRPLETAPRWLAQATNSLSMAGSLLNAGYWSGVCFHAEQTAQLALKSFLFSTGRRQVRVHSVYELAIDCAGQDSDFSAFVAYGGTLDRYYLSTRYPDALPEPAVPFESFTRQEAEQTLGYAQEMVATVRAKVEAASSLSHEPDQNPESL